MGKGRYMSYTDALDYSKEGAAEAADSITQGSLTEIITRYDYPEEMVAEIEEWTEDQIKLGTAEFVKKLTMRMAQSLHGFCVLRALGYHAQVESNGQNITSLRQIARHFGFSHQYVDRVTKDLADQLDATGKNSLGIETKTYSMEVTPPPGYITLGQALKKFKTTTLQIKRAMAQCKLEFKEIERGAKIVKEAKLKKALGKVVNGKRGRKPKQPNQIKVNES